MTIIKMTMVMVKANKPSSSRSSSSSLISFFTFEKILNSLISKCKSESVKVKVWKCESEGVKV